MKPLLVLLGIFLIGLLIKLLSKRKGISTALIGRIAMSGMLLFTGIAHFPFADGMVEMLPNWIPLRKEVVYFTGAVEILAAIGLLTNRYSRITGKYLIIFLLFVLPANIYATLHHIDPVTGISDGPGATYLFFRIPLQFFFILWIYLCTIKPRTAQTTLNSVN